MIGDDERRGTELVHLAPHSSYRFVSVEEQVRCDAPDGENYLWLHKFDLSLQVRSTRG